MQNLELQEVKKCYTVQKEEVWALKGVSYTCTAAKFLAIMGESGSGKSTLLHLISGLERPTSGQIIIDGQNITSMSSRELAEFRRQKVGIIFQHFYLDPTLTVRQNLELPAMFSGMNKAERAKRTQELADFVGLTPYLGHAPSQLSGGQIQRTAIARAIYLHPQILLADEPTSSLDAKNVQMVMTLFQKIQEQYGTAIIVSTHDQAIAARADKVLYLHNGKVAE